MAATVMTNKGRALMSGLITGVTALLPSHIAIGTGTVDPTATSTALTTELTTGNWAGYARLAATMSQQTGSVTNDTAQYQATFTNPGTTNPIAITEAGNFDAATAGNPLLLADFAAINLNTGDSLALTITVKFS